MALQVILSALAGAATKLYLQNFGWLIQLIANYIANFCVFISDIDMRITCIQHVIFTQQQVTKEPIQIIHRARNAGIYIFVIGANQRIAEIFGIVFEQFVISLKSFAAQILNRKHGRGAGISLTKRMNLPDARYKFGDTCRHAGREVVDPDRSCGARHEELSAGERGRELRQLCPPLPCGSHYDDSAERQAGCAEDTLGQCREVHRLRCVRELVPGTSVQCDLRRGTRTTQNHLMRIPL